jgi:hypothetical protein
MPSNALKLGDMKNQVWSVVKDSGSFITPDDIIGWVNEAQMDLAARLGLSQEEISSTTPAGFTIALPPTPSSQDQVVKVTSLRLFPDDDVEFVASENWGAWKDEDGTPLHTIGRIYNGVIELYPTPNTGTAYELRYESLPPPLANDDDASTLPHHLHPRLVYYARAMALLKAGEMGAADRFQQMYENGLPAPDLGKAKLQPGPFTMTFEPGPWDLDPDLSGHLGRR